MCSETELLKKNFTCILQSWWHFEICSYNNLDNTISSERRDAFLAVLGECLSYGYHCYVETLWQKLLWEEDVYLAYTSI